VRSSVSIASRICAGVTRFARSAATNAPGARADVEVEVAVVKFSNNASRARSTPTS
jgi:hypothetical protein